LYKKYPVIAKTCYVETYREDAIAGIAEEAGGLPENIPEDVEGIIEMVNIPFEEMDHKTAEPMVACINDMRDEFKKLIFTPDVIEGINQKCTDMSCKRSMKLTLDYILEAMLKIPLITSDCFDAHGDDLANTKFCIEMNKPESLVIN
jgi:hypothetical protein